MNRRAGKDGSEERAKSPREHEASNDNETEAEARRSRAEEAVEEKEDGELDQDGAYDPGYFYGVLQLEVRIVRLDK